MVPVRDHHSRMRQRSLLDPAITSIDYTHYVHYTHYRDYKSVDQIQMRQEAIAQCGLAFDDTSLDVTTSGAQVCPQVCPPAFFTLTRFLLPVNSINLVSAILRPQLQCDKNGLHATPPSRIPIA